jgi:hypothetical protein
LNASVHLAKFLIVEMTTVYDVVIITLPDNRGCAPPVAGLLSFPLGGTAVAIAIALRFVIEADNLPFALPR